MFLNRKQSQRYCAKCQVLLCKCKQIHRCSPFIPLENKLLGSKKRGKLRICLHLLKKTSQEIFIFCATYCASVIQILINFSLIKSYHRNLTSFIHSFSLYSRNITLKLTQIKSLLSQLIPVERSYKRHEHCSRAYVVNF